MVKTKDIKRSKFGKFFKHWNGNLVLKKKYVIDAKSTNYCFEEENSFINLVNLID